MSEAALLAELVEATRIHSEWAVLREALARRQRVHLAVMVEPYLSYILQGRKSIESRFSKNAIAPYLQIGPDDLVLLKLTQVSLLCRWVLPGQADGLDFCLGRLFGSSGSKSGGDEDAAELGEHVGGGGVGLGAVPGPVGAVGGDVVGLVAGGGVPADRQAQAGQAEEDDGDRLCSEDRVPQAVDGGGVHGGGLAVAVRRGGGEGGGAGQVGQLGQFRAFLPGRPRRPVRGGASS